MNEPILIIGMGNMGTRYSKILDYLKEPWVGIDIDDYIPTSTFSKAIVTTPTDTHYDICKELICKCKDFLCEKPISKDISKVKELASLCERHNIIGSMVCNWSYIFDQRLLPCRNDIFYNCWNTGKDGLFWDCIQLVYLSGGKDKLTLRNDSPYFDCVINSKIVTVRDIESSYIKMIKNFLENPHVLWSMDDAVKASIDVVELMK